MSRYEIYVAILSRPDTPCLRGRGYHYRYVACQTRNPEDIKQYFAQAYVEHCKLEHADISCVVSVRRRPRYAQVA